jgi:hypothetical protein
VHVPSAPRQQASFAPAAAQAVATVTPGVAAPQLQLDIAGTAESSMHAYAPQLQLASVLAGHSSVEAQYQSHPGVWVAGGQLVSGSPALGAVL